MPAGGRHRAEATALTYTFVATCPAVVNSGAPHVLAAVGQDFNIDASRFEEAITENTKAITQVHLNGKTASDEKSPPCQEAGHIF